MNLASRIPLPLPTATKTLFLLNVVVFLANTVLMGALSEPTKGAWFAFSGTGLLDGYGLGLLRVVTYQFTHSFDDVMHVVFNMMSLWFFGPIAESRLGRLGMYRLYLWGGLVGAAGHLIAVAVQGDAGVALVGASGACYAVLVYAACVAPHQQVIFIILCMPLWVLASLLCFIGVYSMFIELSKGYGGGVSHSAHLGGALLGFLTWRLAWFVDYADFGGRARPSWGSRLLGALRRRLAAREQARDSARELELDAILGKVKEHGLNSLTPDERRFLERQSQRARRDS